MRPRQPPEFETPDRHQIYEYVEARGAAPPEEVGETVGLDPESFHHEIELLKRDGYLQERNGKLRIALEAGAAEEYTADGVEFVVRPARQEDYSGILGTIRTITEKGTYLVAETVAEQLDYEGALIRHNRLETRMFFVATVSGDVVGWAHLEAPELEKLSHTAELTVGVLEGYRRHGIGSHLLHRGMEWAASYGYEKVYNSLPATNEAGASFLESHGWNTVAIRKDHYKTGHQYVSELMMAVDL